MVNKKLHYLHILPMTTTLLMNWDMNIGPVTAYVKLLVVWIWGFVEIVFALLAYFFD